MPHQCPECGATCECLQDQYENSPALRCFHDCESEDVGNVDVFVEGESEDQEYV